VDLTKAPAADVTAAAPNEGAAPLAAATATTEAAAKGPETVTVTDTFGRPIQIPREQWRKEILPKMVEANSRDPQRLAALVLQGMRDGLAADMLPAALKLAVVDNDPERSLSVLAAVQRDCGDLDAVELQQKRPQSPAARVGLALLRDKEGRRAEGSALLWEALQADANHPDALHGWLQWEHERLGEAGFPASLDAACALDGAWRAKLWRMRRAFEQQRLDDGIADLRAVMAIAADESDVLIMAASDLQRVGRHDLVAELVLPRYRIERHHPNVGLLLLQHFAQTKQPVLGEQMLHELRVRFPRMLDAQLARFDQEFSRMNAPQVPQQPPAGQPKVLLYRLDQPLWFTSLGEPGWMLPKKPDGHRRVLLAALSVQAPPSSAQVQREDDMGRLSRGVPLFLAEQLWLQSPMRASVVIPVVEGGGWVVSAVPWAEERLVQLMSPEEKQQTLLVSGVVRPEGTKRRIDLWVLDCATGKRVGHAAAEAEADKTGSALLQLLAELSPVLGASAPIKPPIGTEVFWDRHATGLAQLAALVVAQIGALPKDRVFGQRAILEWLLAAALEEPRWAPAKLALAAAMCADAALGSHIHQEMASSLVELFRMEPAASPFAKVGLKPLKVLGLMQVWQQRRAELLANSPAEYQNWVQRLEQA
jgi:hypothetical protein